MLIESDKYIKVLEWANKAAEKVFSNTMRKQQSKFRWLLQTSYRKEERAVYIEHWSRVVVNLSSWHLDGEESRVLSLGMNFALPHRHLPVNELISSTESTARLLDSESAQHLRECVKTCIEKHQPSSRPRLNQQQLNAISRLRKEASIIILRADKGMQLLLWIEVFINRRLEMMTTTDSLKRDPTT